MLVPEGDEETDEWIKERLTKIWFRGGAPRLSGVGSQLSKSTQIRILKGAKAQSQQKEQGVARWAMLTIAHRLGSIDYDKPLATVRARSRVRPHFAKMLRLALIDWVDLVCNRVLSSSRAGKALEPLEACGLKELERHIVHRGI